MSGLVITERGRNVVSALGTSILILICLAGVLFAWDHDSTKYPPDVTGICQSAVNSGAQIPAYSFVIGDC